MEADSGGPGDEQLHAPGVGHQRLAAVDRPHVDRGGAAGQGPEAHIGLELEAHAGRVVQRPAAHRQKGGQAAGGRFEGGGGVRSRDDHLLQHDDPV